MVSRTLPWSLRSAYAPGPPRILLRSLLRGGHAYLDLVDEVAADYGDIASFKLGPTRVWCVFHPHDIEAVLVGHHRDVVKDISTRSLQAVLGRGLLTNEGEDWRRQRRRIAPVFTPTHVRAYADEMVRTTVEHRDAAEPFGDLESTAGRVLDVHRPMSELALDIVVRTIFGSQRRPPYAQIGRLLEDLLTAYGKRLGSWEQIVPMNLPTPTTMTIHRCRRSLDEIVRPMTSQSTSGDAGALIDRLLAVRDDDGLAMDADQIRDEVATLLLAGHETTALSLTYASYLLASHPEQQARLHAELDQVVGSREPGLDDLSELRFTDAVIRESMRLLPPAWSVGREVVESFDLRGYRISKGEQILMSQWVTHRDARWFDDPRCFRPERWLEPAPRRPKFAYFPFGGGPRVCVGNHFAMLSAVLGLATLARRLHFHTTDHTNIKLVPAVTLRPEGGITLWVTRRGTDGQLPASGPAN